MEMIHALPAVGASFGRPVSRIRADEHLGKSGRCPRCGGEVYSATLNGVAQWVHLSRCSPPKRSSRPAS